MALRVETRDKLTEHPAPGEFSSGAPWRAAPEIDVEAAGQRECQWQRDQLPKPIRELALDDQRVRNDICWSVFEC